MSHKEPCTYNAQETIQASSSSKRGNKKRYSQKTSLNVQQIHSSIPIFIKCIYEYHKNKTA